MSLFAFIIGVGLPGALGWMALSLLERSAPVLSRLERLTWAVTLGPTLFVLIAFVSDSLGLSRFTLAGFLIPGLVMLVVLGGLAWRANCLWLPDIQLPDVRPMSVPRWMAIGLIILCLWTGVKVLAGSYDLVTTPTYWDDSFNNWNMRGKMFFVTGNLELEVPVGNGAIQTAQGVGSYPPALPLVKTWLSTIRGAWDEPLVNGVHLIWFLGLIASVYLLLRRHVATPWAALGVYLLVSLPLMLIHGTNPYADVFLASHLLITIACLLGMQAATDQARLRTWLTLFAFSLGLLLFTKNEAIVLYAPTLVLLAAWVLQRSLKRGVVDADGLRRMLTFGLILAAALALPWIGFKLLHGLSFGNAKSVTGLTISFNQTVLQAIWYHFSTEPNWLFLPLALVLAIAAIGKRIVEPHLALLTAFLAVVILGQFAIFAFTPLAVEALMQTGLSRGLLQVAPVAVVLLVMLAEQLLTSD